MTPGVQPPLPGACKSPVSTGPGLGAPEPGDGVTIVMGATGQLSVTSAGRVEICGRYSPNALPVAFTAQPTTGTLGALCATGFPCAALSTGLLVAEAPTAVYVQGTTMLPNREFVISLTPTTQQLYRGGVIARRAGSYSTRALVCARGHLRCRRATRRPRAGPSSTSTSSSVRACRAVPVARVKLRAKVALTDPTGLTVAGARQVSVLSWSLQG